MLETQHLGLFVISAILLNLTPGQDTLYILGRTLAQGRRAGFLSVAGIIAGCGVHTLAAAFGLSAILRTSATAFLIVKWIGAAYLIFLGLQLILQPAGSFASTKDTDDKPEVSGWTIFRSGLLTNLLNPKVSLFFLAFLPQFVSPECESHTLTLLFLGSLFIATGTTWSILLVIAAARLSRNLQSNTSISTALKRAAGVLFVGLGVKAAIASP